MFTARGDSLLQDMPGLYEVVLHLGLVRSESVHRRSRWCRLRVSDTPVQFPGATSWQRGRRQVSDR